MNRQWKPGDVAIRTGKDGSEVRTMVATNPSGLLGTCLCSGKDVPHWHHANGRWNPIPDADEHGTYRPLVVIDPEDREQVERLLEGYAGWVGADERPSDYPHYISLMQTALRAFANPTPPKPDEPTGLGAVVEDDKGRHWVRVFGGETHAAVSDDEGPWKLAYLVTTRRLWANLDAVRVLSEGVTDV